MTFHLIVNKILEIENKNFFTNTSDIDTLLRLYFNLGLNQDIDVKPMYKIKFIFLKEIMNNFLVSAREEEYLSYFNKIQRVYHIFNRFVYNYKFKKSKIVVNTDMILNEIQENEKNIICIYHEKSKYLFRIYELLKIINMSLTNAQNFFANPLCIKNPYNNLPFGKNILYYIHYFITEKTNIASKITYTDLFLKFHHCHFNLTSFLNNYEYLLREHSILNYVKNSMNDILYRDITIMIQNFNHTKCQKNKIYINEKFPKSKVVQVFIPYLLLCINSKHLLITTLKHNAACKLEKKLVEFQKYNPLFGRCKIIYGEKKYIDGKTRNFKIGEEINDKHVNFYENDNETFLQDHLTFKQIHYPYDDDDDDDDDDTEDENDTEDDSLS